MLNAIKRYEWWELIKAILFLPCVFLAVTYAFSWLCMAAPLWAPIGLAHDFVINIWIGLALCNIPGILSWCIFVYFMDDVDAEFTDHALAFWLCVLMAALFGPFYIRG